MRGVQWARIVALVACVVVPLGRMIFFQDSSKSEAASAPAISAAVFSPSGGPYSPTIAPSDQVVSPVAPTPPPRHAPPRRAPGLAWLPLSFAAAVIGGLAWVEFSPARRRRRPGELA